MIYLLIGPIGAGKTSVGNTIAQKLGYEFLELDEQALRRSGFETIRDAFKNGSTKFKEAELEVAKKLSQKDNMVIACGGGMVVNQLNFDYFRESGKEVKIVYLNVTPQTQVERLVEKHAFFEEKQKEILEGVKKIYEERDFLYRLISDQIVDTQKLGVDEVVKAILK
jgi:shikimate kinase